MKRLKPRGDIWTPRQLAEVIGMSTQFVLTEIRAGELQASRFGSVWRIRSTEVARYLAEKQFPMPDAERDATEA